MLAATGESFPVTLFLFCFTAGPHGTSRTSRPCGCSCKYRVFLLRGSEDAFQLSCVTLWANVVSSCYVLGTSRISRQPW